MSYDVKSDMKVGIDRGKKWVYDNVYQLVKAPCSGRLFLFLRDRVKYDAIESAEAAGMLEIRKGYRMEEILW